MHTNLEERNVEAKCYELGHVEQVLNEIKLNFDKYYSRFVTTEAGHILPSEDLKNIVKNWGIQDVKISNNKNDREKFLNIYKDAINYFEKDREKYQNIFNENRLLEYEDDPYTFKSEILKNNCPIIHATIYNKQAKELDKYRYEFSISDPNELLTVVTNLYYFGEDYYGSIYDKEKYDKLGNYEELGYGDLDTSDYTAYGVIGGGIKTHMLYKVYPEIFPNRSRDAIWALWYLTDKKSFGCRYDSEFLMIDVSKVITQQNYFYPYELFAFYAHQIFQLINKKTKSIEISIDLEYRYVIVDAFLSFIAEQHREEISLLSRQIQNGGYGYD